MRRLIGLLKRKRAPAQPGPKPREQWSASDWARVRAPQRTRDAQLSDKARRWLERLPDEMRPHALCAQFPRIANQLAAHWSDVGLTEHLLEDLLIDRRGSRQGFPPPVAEEIALLYECHDLRLQARRGGAPGWASSTLGF